MSEPAPHVEVQPAATVMLVRDAGERRGGSLEVLMLRRHPESVFAADAWVFPGGRVDDGDGAGMPLGAGPSDEEASAALGLPSGGLAYWVAAARECFEEAGILLARHADTGVWLDTSSEWSAARLARHRRDVHAGAASLGVVLEAEGLVLDLSGVHYVSHWITPPGRTARRFDTRFFVAAVPPGQVASHDATETVESLWITPADALARGAVGEIVLVIPTIANLQALAQFSSTEELVASARAIGHVPVAAPRFRGDPSVPAGVLAPQSPPDAGPEAGGPGGSPEETACPT
ncbi:MAG TPA: NUDIX hydrolase [Acidimicrobiia bacterium]|jgi:8-oxo-dGTP pyrophosphatase MutT (NUDIX family)|nr:NUDIX hydrolase [Acidimicrobiia bacterium]